MLEKLRWAAVLKNNGDTMAATIAECQKTEGKLAKLVEPVGVIATQYTAQGLTIAHDAGITTAVVPRAEFSESDDGIVSFSLALLKTIKMFQPDLVTLPSHIQISEEVMRAFGGEIFSQHPGPISDFSGEGMIGIVVHEAVLQFLRRVNRDVPYTRVDVRRIHPNPEVVQFKMIRIETETDPKDKVQKGERNRIIDTARTLEIRAGIIRQDLQIQLLRERATNSLQPLSPLAIQPFVLSHEQESLREAKEAAGRKYRKPSSNGNK